MDIRKRNGKVTIRKPGGETVMQGSLQGTTNCSFYIMDCTIAPPLSYPGNIAFSAQYKQSLDLWHRRYAHIHEGGLRYLVKHKLVTGLDIQTNGELRPCDGCALGKPRGNIINPLFRRKPKGASESIYSTQRRFSLLRSRVTPSPPI